MESRVVKFSQCHEVYLLLLFVNAFVKTMSIMIENLVNHCYP